MFLKSKSTLGLLRVAAIGMFILGAGTYAKAAVPTITCIFNAHASANPLDAFTVSATAALNSTPPVSVEKEIVYAPIGKNGSRVGAKVAYSLKVASIATGTWGLIIRITDRSKLNEVLLAENYSIVLENNANGVFVSNLVFPILAEQALENSHIKTRCSIQN